MSILDDLKKTTSLSDLALLLGFKPNSLSYILYKITDENKYSEFTIPKKNGGERLIKAPADRLKKLQKRLAVLLDECFEEIYKGYGNNKSLSHGFRKDHSIITNAKRHKNKRYVFNIDLQDFFPSINFGRVRGFFIKNSHFELNAKVATVIAQIACHDNELPQGSPCSPVISNLIGHLLDIRMVNLAKKTKCTYSRYADDLTFSTNEKDFPKDIAYEANFGNWVPGKALIKEIEKVNFTINNKKVSMQYKTRRQCVTGLIVNKKVNIKKEYYKKSRTMCHVLFQTDEFYIKSTSDEIKPGTVNQLNGILSFIYNVKEPNNIKKKELNKKKGKKKEDKKKDSAVKNLYKKFLFYKHFFSLDRPLIICEGKTDIIHLKCAIRQFEKEYPEFVEKNGDSFNFKVSFLRFSDNLKDVFSTAEGTSGLKSIMVSYKYHMEIFKGQGKKHPVIMLVDNDAGANEIIKILKVKDYKQPFHYFLENLYVVLLPQKEDGQEMAIEDLFDKETLETKVGGKTFNRKKIDDEKEYGKIVFAKHVIEAHQKEINFINFKELLNRFKAVLVDYNNKLTAS